MRPSPFASDVPTSAKPGQSPGIIPPEYLPRPGLDPLAHAFERKIAIHAGLSGKPATGQEAAAVVADIQSNPRKGKSAAYVHLPFCETHCLYCGFFGGRYIEEKTDAYLDALLAQLAAEQNTPAVQSGPIHALYLGGGTPTALSAKQLDRLLQALVTTLPLANDCEITVEGRIHNFTDEKMRACINAGVNRFSLGVQSFDTSLRRQLGRIDTQKTVITRLEALAAFDQAAIVADLIYGLPGQSLKQWEDDIRLFLALPLDGVDLYQLNVFPGGRLHDAIARGSVPPAADIPEQSRFFARGVELMTEAGMRRLSISHWGKNSRERNLYNPLTKSRSDCLAYGAGAGGLLQGHFYVLDSKPDSYMDRVNAGEKPVGMVMAPPEHFGLMRVVLGQMEQGFLDLASVEQAGGPEAGSIMSPLLEAWKEGALLTRNGDRFTLTLAGQFWQVTLAQLLLSWHKRTPAN